MRDAHVNEMIDSYLTRRIDARADGNQIDFFELIGFAGRRVRRSDQMNQRVARVQCGCDRLIVERITDNSRSALGHTRNGVRAREHAHTMTTRDQWRNEIAADISGAACDEYIERSCHCQNCKTS